MQEIIMRPLAQDILLTEFDRRRLQGLLQVLRKRSAVDLWNLDALELELARAEVVAPECVPPNVVTMNSRVRLLDLDSGERTSVSLVFPDAAPNDGVNVPVLSPLGLALLGCREGDVMAWPTPEGMRKLSLERVIYQPEAAGHYFS
jgi:regulator of nucleoside diphosphate kinase